MIEPHDRGVWLGEAGALVEFTEPAAGIYLGEVGTLVEYSGDPITYTADLPSFAEAGLLVEFAEPAEGLRAGEAGALVEFTEPAAGIYLGEVGILVEYSGDPITYTADLPSFAEAGVLLEFIGWIGDEETTAPALFKFGPILWVM